MDLGLCTTFSPFSLGWPARPWWTLLGPNLGLLGLVYSRDMGRKKSHSNNKPKVKFGPIKHVEPIPISGNPKTDIHTAYGTPETLPETTNPKTPPAAKVCLEKQIELDESPSVSQSLGEEDTDEEPSCAETEMPTKDEKHRENGENKTAPWVNLFKDNRSPEEGIKLKYIKDQPDIITVEETDLVDIEKKIGYCAVGYIAGRFPGKQALLAMCNNWKVEYQYYVHRSGWLIFKFKDMASRASVLQGGPYFVFGRPLMLKEMPKCFEFDESEISTIPVWITLPGLPLDMWTDNMLNKIVSKIGVPISTDRLTATQDCLSYARVLVEVDVSKELIHSVTMNMINNKVRVQEVEYEHVPKFCATCRVFGHSTIDCKITKRGNKQNLVQKTKSNQGKEMADKKETEKETETEQVNPDIVEVPKQDDQIGTKSIEEVEEPFIQVAGKKKGTKNKQMQTGQNAKLLQTGQSSTSDPDRGRNLSKTASNVQRENSKDGMQTKAQRNSSTTDKGKSKDEKLALPPPTTKERKKGSALPSSSS